MQTISVLLSLLFALITLARAEGAQRHALVVADTEGVHTLCPVSHDVDIDILGFVAEITVNERYVIDEGTAGKQTVAFAGSELCELLECSLTVDGNLMANGSSRDSVGLTLIPGPQGTNGTVVGLTLRYALLLPRTHGTYELAYQVPEIVPVNDSSRDNDMQAAPWLAATVTGGMPIRGLSTPSHESEIWYEGTRRARVVPDLERRGGETFVLQYSLAGEEIVDEFFELETPDGEVIYMLVEPAAKR